MAAAGVDASNVEPGHVVLLPEDPDASASALRDAVASLNDDEKAALGPLVAEPPPPSSTPAAPARSRPTRCATCA